MKALLVEPKYRTKYPNLALMKLSTKLKREGYEVEYFKGMKPRTLEDTTNGGYDHIYITSLFTYDSEVTLETINYYKKAYSYSKIIVGGIFASLNPEIVEQRTGIKPFTGYSKELDLLPPDYSLIKTDSKWDDFSYVFTSRGCTNTCPYCAVPRIEPEPWINPNWREAIDLEKPAVMISDNNLTSQPMSHFIEVMDFLKEHNLKVIFDNGWDCRLFTEEHLRHIQGVKFIRQGLRFAFDNMSQEGHIQRTLRMCLDGGIAKSHLMVYVLFNYTETPMEADYRMRVPIELGANSYPQRYVPLDKMTRRPAFVGKYWTASLVQTFRFFYLMHGYNKKMTFLEYLQNPKRVKDRHLMGAFKRHKWSKPDSVGMVGK